MPQEQGLSFVELFLAADIVVKSVMVLLAAASVASWTVMIEKLIRFAALRRQTRAFERASACRACKARARRALRQEAQTWATSYTLEI